MPELRQGVSIAGPARTVSATTTAQRNSAALSPGHYRVKISGAPCYVLQGSSSVTATTTTATLYDPGSVIDITVPATGATFSYLSILSSATSTVYVSGADESTAASQPGAWA